MELRNKFVMGAGAHAYIAVNITYQYWSCVIKYMLLLVISE